MKWTTIIYLYGSLTVLSSLIWITFAVAPVITNLNNSTQISEDTTVETLLYTVSVTDTDTDSSDITCSLGTASNPVTSGNFFRLRQVTGTTDWGIYTLAEVTFSYSAQSQYDLDIECDDGTTTVEGTFIVYISQNAAPTFINLPNTTSLSSDAAIGDAIFSVLVSDPENDQIYFSVSCSPAGCPFIIFESGEMKVDASLPSSAIAYDVTVNISDAKNTVTPLILTVDISDINDTPTITNLGTTISVSENTAVSTLLATTTCTDPDIADTLTYSMTCTSSEGLTYFQINSSSGELSTSSSSTTNYEALTAGTTSFVCDVVCSDGELSDTATVTFDVTNVNEAPAFQQSGYSITVDEGVQGTILHSAGYTVADPDTSDSQIYSLNCGSHTSYFTIDQNTGNTNYSSDYDVDDGSRPFNVTCNLTVTDSGGLTDTVDLSFYINNINDNMPIFSPSFYSWFISYGADISEVAGYVTATDADAGIFGDITYSLDQTSLGADYFGISSGQVYVTQNFTNLSEGATYFFNATATDGGATSAVASISLVFISTTTITTTTTTDRYRTFFEDTRNVAWFTACCLILAVIIAFGFYLFCVMYEGNKMLSKASLRCDCCKLERNYRVATPVELVPTPPPPPPPAPSPPSPLPPPSPPVRVLEKPPAKAFDFWFETEHVG